jgi:hypothetical protein
LFLYTTLFFGTTLVRTTLLFYPTSFLLQTALLLLLLAAEVRRRSAGTSAIAAIAATHAGHADFVLKLVNPLSARRRIVFLVGRKLLDPLESLELPHHLLGRIDRRRRRHNRL